MRQLPLFFTVRDRAVLVVGGGEAAARKLRLLLKAGARPVVVAPRVTAEIAALADEGRITWHGRAFREGDVAGVALSYGATGNDAVDRSVADAAQAAGVPVNVVDRADLSDFITPAIVERDPITVAVSSGGAAPVLARTVKAAIERLLPPATGRLALFAERFRGAVKAVVPGERARLRFWDGFFAGPVAAKVLAGDETGAAEDMLGLVNRRAAGPDRGVVHIVGAGPGAADLITLRAQRLLQQADVIVHDRLVTSDVLDLARRDAERINVGKGPGRHTVPQDRINEILIEQGRLGRRVVRLKGGDPFIFGRGGEELQALQAAGIHAEVVPGVTAAIGCAAAVGLPLTHRDVTGAVTFVTGQGSVNGRPVDWESLARSGATLAVYMGVGQAPEIARELARHGMADTPVAVIENGTRPDQRIVTGRVRGLAALMSMHCISGPALIVIGEVAALTQETEYPHSVETFERVAAAG